MLYLAGGSSLLLGLGFQPRDGVWCVRVLTPERPSVCSAWFSPEPGVVFGRVLCSVAPACDTAVRHVLLLWSLVCPGQMQGVVHIYEYTYTCCVYASKYICIYASKYTVAHFFQAAGDGMNVSPVATLFQSGMYARHRSSLHQKRGMFPIFSFATPTRFCGEMKTVSLENEGNRLVFVARRVLSCSPSDHHTSIPRRLFFFFFFVARRCLAAMPTCTLSRTGCWDDQPRGCRPGRGLLGKAATQHAYVRP